MNFLQIKSMQQAVGAVPDGFWGPRSIATCQKHLRSLMPSPNPWPKSDQASLTRFYGQPGDEAQLVDLSVAGLGVKYEGVIVKTVRCHKRVAKSLLRILTELAVSHPEVVAQYAGCYAFRPMTGGHLPSLHARGAAIDLDPDTNGFHDCWPIRSTMPLAVMEAFAREGWKGAGAFWGYDGMHFEATS